MPAASRELAIPIPHEEIAAFCRKWGIKRLSFFGSIVRDDFDPERSDVDVLVELRPDTKARGLAFFGADQDQPQSFGHGKAENMTRRRDSATAHGQPDPAGDYAE